MGCQATLAYLSRFLDSELDAGRLTGTGDSTGAHEVAASRARLQEGHAAAGQLAVKLRAAAHEVTGTTTTVFA